MLTTLPLMAALCLTPGQAGGPTLTDARVTHGILGPTRDNAKFLPGDTLFLTFTIDGITADANGKVLYNIAHEVTDATGKKVSGQPAQDREAINALGGTQMPAFAQVSIGLQQPAGDYTLKVTVTDRATKKSQSLTQKFEVLKPDFGLVRLSTSADADGQVPAGLLCVGQSLWLHGAVVGFQRGADRQPNVTLELTVARRRRQADAGQALRRDDQQGRAAQGRVVAGPVPRVAQPAGKVHRRDQADRPAAGKTVTQSFPITVNAVKYAGGATGRLS